MVRIEPGRAEDVEQVRRISQEVFAEYGDYGRILPRFYATQGVHSYLAWNNGQVIGFVLLGLLPWSRDEEETDWWLADLLAIAVVPAQRRRGIGDRLMQRAFELVQEMSEWRDLKEVQLTCSADNSAALTFFRRWGFEVTDKDHGCYSGGQAAWRLAKPIAAKGR